MWCSKLNYIDDVLLYDITDGNDIYNGDCDDDNDGYNIQLF